MEAQLVESYGVMDRIYILENLTHFCLSNKRRELCRLNQIASTRYVANINRTITMSFKTFHKLLIDHDRLSDSCWNSEMRSRAGEKRDIWWQVRLSIPVNQFS